MKVYIMSSPDDHVIALTYDPAIVALAKEAADEAG